MTDNAEKLIDNLAALKKPGKTLGKTLDASPSVSSIAAASGVGKPASAADGGSIASPLTETAYADRTFWTQKTLLSSDGIFVLKWTPIKSVKFTDANSSEVVMNYKDAP